jgi:hypothetical protein
MMMMITCNIHHVSTGGPIYSRKKSIIGYVGGADRKVSIHPRPLS